MTDRDSLLAAVVADPDDPMPRLVFADYLDEHGDPDWAELIRLQNGYFKHWTNAEDMKEREAELIEMVTAKYPNVPWVELGPPVRGFPDEVAFQSDNHEYGPELGALLAAYPITRFVCRAALPIELIDRRLLRTAAVLDLSTNHVDSLTDVLDAVDTNRLRCLKWQMANLGYDDAETIAHDRRLAELLELDLSINEITAAGCDALIRSPYLTRLEYLDLSGNPVGSAAGRLERRFGAALRLA